MIKVFEFGAYLKGKRMEAGFSSASKASAKIGISRMHMCDLERGFKTPSFTLLRKLADLYKVPYLDMLRELITYDDENMEKLQAVFGGVSPACVFYVISELEDLLERFGKEDDDNVKEDE